jgi:cation diffusion facilitator CzcD-associated flavoprotein CzcO
MKRNPAVCVIGAGMTGILMVKKLRDIGITDIVVFEKKDEIGGTWRENTYPGVACDVPSHMYTYSFEPNPNWSNFFARGPEIKAYFEHVTDKYDIRQHIHFNEAVSDAVYDAGKWYVKTVQNKDYVFDFVISATGILHHPAYPEIEGLDTFEGSTFHTAEWDHSVNTGSGSRVGIIGTGSTAAQAIPELVNSGAEVTVFQRTPQWVLPLKDFNISDKAKRLFNRFGFIHRFMRRFAIFFMEHMFTKAVTGHPIQKKILEWACKSNLRLSIKNSALRDKLRPNYQVGCKRVIVNTTFYPAIQKDNAHLVTERIDRITPAGVLTTDGVLHKLDVLVLSTGFKPLSFMRPMNMTGKDGLHINDAWAHSVKAYRSMLLPHFPNFFLMLGPNTPIGNFSVIAMSEVQSDYVLKLINKWRENEFDELEPKPEAITRFNDYVKRGLKGTAWVGGCQSWYLDADGDPILWPYTWAKWIEEMAEPNMADLDAVQFSAQQQSNVA